MLFEASRKYGELDKLVVSYKRSDILFHVPSSGIMKT